jgi:hypothetical protein
MNHYKDVPFTFEGEDYKIRVFYDENSINILAFKNHYPASGFRHQIKIPKNVPVKNVLNQDVINEYVEICKKDISEKLWERLLGKK